MTRNTNDATKPDYTRPEVIDAAEDLSVIHDLLGGPRQMWGKSTAYIRKWTDEERAVYDIRRLCEPCADLFGRVLSASVGKMFAKPPKLTFETQEAVLRAHLDNLDGRGTKGDIAFKEFASQSIADGFALILVDHPARPEGVQVTAANEGDYNLRPFWAFYPRSALLSWRVETIANVEVLTQAVLYEAVEEAAGDFGTQTAHRYRELFVAGGVAQWRLWQKPEDENAPFLLVGAGQFKNKRGQTRNTIPLACGYAGRREGWFQAAPPLRSVAYANVAHWTVATNLRFGSDVAAIEQPVVVGRILSADGNDTGTLKMGWLTGINVSEGGSFSFEGPSGEGLNQLLARKVEKEQEIAAMGLSFISRDTRAAETAEAKRLDAAAEDASLATSAQGIEDALNVAGELHCWYLGMEKAQAFTVTLNRDYEGTTLSPQHAQAIAALVTSGMPVMQAVRTLVVGGFLKAEEEEIDEIAMAWEAGQADAQAREDEQREASVARMREAA